MNYEDELAKLGRRNARLTRGAAFVAAIGSLAISSVFVLAESCADVAMPCEYYRGTAWSAPARCIPELSK